MKLSCLPALGTALCVKAGDYHNPILLNIEEDSIGKAPDASTPPSFVENRKLQWVFCDSFDCCVNGERETLSKLRTYPVILRSGFPQLRVSLGYPNDWECHGLWNKPALTCPHGITSEGFCSCREMR